MKEFFRQKKVGIKQILSNQVFVEFKKIKKEA